MLEQDPVADGQRFVPTTKGEAQRVLGEAAGAIAPVVCEHLVDVRVERGPGGGLEDDQWLVITQASRRDL